MAEKRRQLRLHLFELEKLLQATGFWDQSMPEPEALASTQPFAIDTLELYQWLQWIFLPRMHELLDRELDLPASCGVAPVAEEWVKMRELQAIKQAQALLDCLATIDELVGSL